MWGAVSVNDFALAWWQRLLLNMFHIHSWKSPMEFTNIPHRVNLLSYQWLHSRDTQNLPNIAVLDLNHSRSAFTARAYSGLTSIILLARRRGFIAYQMAVSEEMTCPNPTGSFKCMFYSCACSRWKSRHINVWLLIFLFKYAVYPTSTRNVLKVNVENSTQDVRKDQVDDFCETRNLSNLKSFNTL
jgi:hypothetical protein